MGLDWDKIDQQKNRLEERLSKGGGTRAKFWKPKPGKNNIRVMPSWASEGDFQGQFWREVAQHWNVSEEQKGPILCPKNTPNLEGKCPICDLVEELKKDKTNIAAQETAKDIRAKTAYLLNVVDLDDDQYTAQDVAEFKKARPDADEVPFEVGDIKVQLYACPSTVFNQILGAIQANKSDITDPESGRNVILTKSGKGLKTRYETTMAFETSQAPPAKTLPALDEVGYQMQYEQMLDLLVEGAGGDFAALLPSETGAPTDSAEDADDSAEALRNQMLSELNA